MAFARSIEWIDDISELTRAFTHIATCGSPRLIGLRQPDKPIWRDNLGETAAAIRMGCGGR